MNKDRYVFSQVADFVPYYEFSLFVKKYSGDKHIRRLSCRDQFKKAQGLYGGDNGFAIELENADVGIDNSDFQDPVIKCGINFCDDD